MSFALMRSDGNGSSAPAGFLLAARLDNGRPSICAENPPSLSGEGDLGRYAIKGDKSHFAEERGSLRRGANRISWDPHKTPLLNMMRAQRICQGKRCGSRFLWRNYTPLERLYPCLMEPNSKLGVPTNTAAHDDISRIQRCVARFNFRYSQEFIRRRRLDTICSTRNGS